MAYQHSPEDQTLRLQAEAGEDDVIHLPSGLERVHCERQEEEEAHLPRSRVQAAGRFSPLRCSEVWMTQLVKLLIAVPTTGDWNQDFANIHSCLEITIVSARR